MKTCTIETKMTNTDPIEERLATLIKGFRPKFGDANSIEIKKRYARILALREKVAKHNKKIKSLRTAVSRKTRDQRDLDTAQKSLIYDLEKLSPLSTDL